MLYGCNHSLIQLFLPLCNTYLTKLAWTAAGYSGEPDRINLLQGVLLGGQMSELGGVGRDNYKLT